jgi:hypothetical protein
MASLLCDWRKEAVGLFPRYRQSVAAGYGWQAASRNTSPIRVAPYTVHMLLLAADAAYR